MHKIAFRAWDKKINEWFYWNVLDPFTNKWSKYIELDWATLGEFTGLLDSKGVEIYEGDVVKTYQNKGVIVFIDSSFRVDYSNEKCILDFLSTPSRLKLEIIGNIYEKPELLTTP